MRAVIYDGKQWNEYRCTQRRDGLHVRINRSITVFTNDQIQYRAYGLAVLCIEAVALSDHIALERARKQIALSAIFNSGGDLTRIVQIVSIVIPIAASVYMAMTISSLTAYQSEVTALIAMLKNSRLFQ